MPSPTPLPVPQVPLPASSIALFTAINSHVHNYMSAYDSSHDYAHILRVLSNANTLLALELAKTPSVTYDTTLLFLSALLHDVGDHKYAKPSEDPTTAARDILLSYGATPALASAVQTLVTHVSYSHETRDPAAVATVLAQHPELGIVQDADRLDAIGAVGIGRCFAFGAAKFPDQPMERAIEHFGEKLVKLEGMMKTESGRALARRRTEVVRRFAEEWREETALSFGLGDGV